MYKAFPCSDYYGDSVVIYDIQGANPIAFPHSYLDIPDLDI